jgi:hypothetical protein
MQENQSIAENRSFETPWEVGRRMRAAAGRAVFMAPKIPSDGIDF